MGHALSKRKRRRRSDGSGNDTNTNNDGSPINNTDTVEPKPLRVSPVVCHAEERNLSYARPFAPGVATPSVHHTPPTPSSSPGVQSSCDPMFPPWEEEDVRKESFFALESPYTDPDGLLRMSPAQENQFHEWRRMSALLHVRPRVVVGRTVLGELVSQSLVADCSFLSALSALANFEARHATPLITGLLFPQDDTHRPLFNPMGKYVVRVFLNGIARKVTIDDLLPVGPERRPLVSTSANPKELWVMILEKAYAKVMGGYDLVGSDPTTDMQLLSGWLPERLQFHGPIVGLAGHDHWSRIHNGFVEGRCAACLSMGDVVDPVECLEFGALVCRETGLVANHSYAVLDMRNVRGLCMLQVKNPWAKCRWKGHFSEYDVEAWTSDLQRELNFNLQSQFHVDNGIFWIEWTDVCKYFQGIHIAWNTVYFPFLRQVHGSWSEAQLGGPLDDYRHYYENPQYVLALCTSRKTVMHLLLSQHVSLPHHREACDFIALHVFEKKDTSRVYHPERAIHSGVYLNAVDVNADFDIPPGDHSYFIVASHMEKKQRSFTLRAFSDAHFDLTPLPMRMDPFTTTHHGAWDPSSAGGCPNASNPLWYTNPMFLLNLESAPAPCLIKLTAAEDVCVNVLVLCACERVDVLTPDDIVASSGAYRECFAVVEHTLPHRVYVVVVSTMEPGQIGTFKLEISSAVSELILKPLPSEGAGMVKTAIQSEWTPHCAGGCARFGRYTENPAYLIRASGAIQLAARLQTIEMGYPSINIKVLHGQHLVASSGAYSNAPCGASIGLIHLPASPTGFVLVVSTFQPQVGRFVLTIYTSEPVVCHAIQ